MTKSGIPSEFRNYKPSVLDQIRVNLDNAKHANDPLPPTPVIVKNIVDYGTGQQLVTTQPTQIVGVRFNRSGVKITNLGSTEVFIGSSAGVLPSTGDLLPAGRGQWLFIPSRSPIFAIVATGTQAVAWSEVFE